MTLTALARPASPSSPATPQVSPEPLNGRSVRLYGDGTLARHIGHALLDHGVRSLTVVAASPRQGADPWRGFVHEPSDWLRVRFDRHWVSDRADYDLAIVTGPGVEPDRAVLADLARCGVPALIVGVHAGTARVGPLFAGPATGCWRCFDLCLADVVPGWTAMLPELARRPARPSTTLLRWATGHVILEACAFLRFGTCDLVGCSVSWEDEHPGLQVSEWPRHPGCRGH